mgnify:CR=1 FL=1
MNFNMSVNIGKIILAMLHSCVLSACLDDTNTSLNDGYILPGSDWSDLLANESGYIIDEGLSSGWSKKKIVRPDSNGLKSPFFDALQSPDGNIHFVYYNYGGQKDEKGQFQFNLKHLEWNPTTQESHMGRASATIETVNHSDQMSLAQDAQGQMYLAYRGGEIKACNGAKVLADAMFSVFDGDTWHPYLGAQGYVARSGGPFMDGHAGSKVEVAVDSQSNVHLIYQYMYEGCDATNFAFPDLFYVHKQPFQFAQDNRDASTIEEQISGNDYVTGGNFQNDTGAITDIVIDQYDSPVIFYYEQSATLSKGLYVSYKENGEWVKETINSECIVSDVSAVINKNDDLYVAYVAQSCENDPDTRFSLRFAKKITSSELQTGWQDTYLEEGVLVGGLGRHLDMALDSNEKPVIVYFELATYTDVELNTLKLIRFNDTWQPSKTLLSQGFHIGLHNKVWLGFDGKLNVASFSQDDGAIYLLSERHLY